MTQLSTTYSNTSGTIDITGSTGADTLFTTPMAAVFGNAEIRHRLSVGVTFLNAGSGDQIVCLAGTLDLSNNGLIVHGGSLATITNQIESGIDAYTWAGTGIEELLSKVVDEAVQTPFMSQL